MKNSPPIKPAKKRTKLVKTVIRTLILVLIAAVIGINIYSLNASRLAGNSVPMPFGVGAAVVLSGSMEPELSAGDLLIVAKRDGYAVGDVVVFQDGRIAVTHRIISLSDNAVITKGDANNTPDAPIGPEQIKGKVLLAVPLVGYLVNAIKTPIGTLIIIAAAIFLLERSFSKEKKKDAEELDIIRSEIEMLKQEKDK